jgi:hypothetical protein
METKVHYLIQKSPLPDPILGQTNPVYASTFHFLKIQFNTLPSKPITFKWSSYLTFMYHRRYIFIANGSAVKIADLNKYQTSFIPLYYGQSYKFWKLLRNPKTEWCFLISRVYIHP